MAARLFSSFKLLEQRAPSSLLGWSSRDKSHPLDKFVRLRLQLGFTAKWIQYTCAFCSINSSSKSSLFRSEISSKMAAYLNACSMPMQRISTAQPVKWLLNVAPPTALFTSGERNPELMMMGSSPDHGVGSTDHFLKFLYYTSFLTPHDPTSKFST